MSLKNDKNDLEASQEPEAKKNVKEAGLSRRRFIKIGAATLTISVVGGGVAKLLLPRRKETGSINASEERPNKNPAFSVRREPDGSFVFLSRLPDGNILRHELNCVGAELYLACDGHRTRVEIIRQAATKLRKDIKKFTPEAQEYLTELERQNLIVTTQKVKLFYRTLVHYEQA